MSNGGQEKFCLNITEGLPWRGWELDCIYVEDE